MTGIPYSAPNDAAPASIAGGESSPSEIFAAAADQMRLVDNWSASYTALEQAYDTRSRAIKAAFGVDLGNPVTDPAARALDVDQKYAGIAAGQKRYQQQLEALAREHADPDSRGIIGAGRPVEKDAETLAAAADSRLGTLMAANPSWMGNIAEFGGGALGGLRDPMTLGSLAFGGGPGAARTVAGRVLAVGAKEALINAGTTAIVQPEVQAWRKQAGLPNGFDEAAQNVLWAAAFGGVLGTAGRGLHETIDVLAKARPALPAPVRGAIDAAEQTAAADAVKPEGVPAETFDQMRNRAAVNVQAREPAPLPDFVPDETQVNRIVNSLAPAPESISEPATPRSDAELDQLISDVTEPGRAAMTAPTPVLDYLRSLGGIDPKSDVADELRAAGVTSRSVFRKGGLTSLDNLPHDELPESVRHSIADDGNGYADQDALVQAAGGEGQSFAAGRTVDDMAALRDHYERQGVDFSAPREEVRAAIRAADDAEHRYGAAEARSGQGQPLTDEATHVPPGLTRRQHTDQLVREALRLQPGLGSETIRHAVNLSLFEGVPIEEGLDDAMGRDAAQEIAAISAAYDQVHAEPEGPAADPLVRISPAEIEGAILERGAMKDVSEVDVRSKRGFGLVKIIWKHGEESELPEALRVHKSDVLALPHVIRDFEPASESGRGREWRVRRDGRTIVYADTLFPDGERHVVTVHVDRGEGGALSKPRASQPVPSRVLTTPKDTAGKLSTALPGAAERPDGTIDLSELGSNPEPLEAEPGAAEAPAIDFEAERAALEELGFSGDVKLPIGDELMSLDELKERLEESRHLESVVNACKA